MASLRTVYVVQKRQPTNCIFGLTEKQWTEIRKWCASRSADASLEIQCVCGYKFQLWEDAVAIAGPEYVSRGNLSEFVCKHPELKEETDEDASV